MDLVIGMRRCILAIALLISASPWSVRADDPPTQVPVVEAKPAARPAQTQWLDRVAEFFRKPIVNIALVTIGVIGLIFEIKFPGTTFPGSVAAIAFVLFFWCHSFVGDGGITILAILLFLLGLVFLGIEVFIVPGLCFAGVAGVALMFVGLILVTLDHWPADQNDWMNVGESFGSIAIGLALAVISAIAITWSLPNLPLLNRMVLKPPAEETDTANVSLSNSGVVALLGAIGVAVTHLRPSGKAQFGEQFVDVLAEGGYVAPGGRVRVVEIEGPHVVVKEV
jgi:membrane-bound serine protease (ClpP class)